MLKLFTFKHVWLHQHLVADYQCTDVVPIFLVLCKYMLNSAVLVSAFDCLMSPLLSILLFISTWFFSTPLSLCKPGQKWMDHGSERMVQGNVH